MPFAGLGQFNLWQLGPAASEVTFTRCPLVSDALFWAYERYSLARSTATGRLGRTTCVGPPAGLLFFSTYTLLVLFWAEIYYQARSLPTGSLRPLFVLLNVAVYAIEVRLVAMWLEASM